MKHFKLYMTLLSSLLLAACSHEEEPSPTPGGEDASVTVSVSVDGVAATKATMQGDTGTTEPGSTDENKIKNLTVVFFDEQSNEVIGHGYYAIGEGEEGSNTITSKSVSMKTGTYKMLLIANTPDVASFKPTDYYDGITTSLDKQGGTDGYVMSNEGETIEIIHKETSITAQVKRVVARIDLSTLAVNLRNLELRDMEGLQFKAKQVFLANVRPNSNLFDTSTWLLPGDAAKHPIEHTGGGFLCGIDNPAPDGEIVAGNVQADYLLKTIDVSLGQGASQENPASFYVMTNSDKKDDNAPVLLYIKGDLYDSKHNKNILTNRYYRIKLENGVKRNTVYKVAATIVGIGSSVPGINQEDIQLSAEIKIQSWDGKDLDKITIDEDIEL